MRPSYMHDSLCELGVTAYAYRPPIRGENAFCDSGFLNLGAPSLFVMRWQRVIRPHDDDPQPAALLLIYRFAYDVATGQVYVDARRDPECNTACWDAAIPREYRDRYRHCLPVRNVTAVRLATSLMQAAEQAARGAARIPATVELPEFFLAFDPATPPVFEDSPALRADAAADLDRPAAELTEAELRACWDRRLVGDGFVGVRQEYLARQDVPYPAHPLDGSAPPTGPGRPGEHRGLWYFRDGRWSPLAQRPAQVLVRMDRVCGRAMRNPAFTVLRRQGMLPGILTYPEFARDPDGWVQLARERVQATVDLDPALADRLLADMRAALGGARDRADDDDLAVALDRPDRPIRLSRESRVGLVRYHGIPRADALTYRFAGGYVDLYSVKPQWIGHIEPARCDPHGRVNRGHPVRQSAGR